MSKDGSGSVIKFAEDYPKTYSNYFSTIRRRDKNLITGNWYTMKTPRREFKALLIVQNYLRVCEIPEFTLCKDTNTNTREEGLKVLRKFYPDLKLKDFVIIYWFSQGDGTSGNGGPRSMADIPGNRTHPVAGYRP